MLIAAACPLANGCLQTQVDLLEEYTLVTIPGLAGTEKKFKFAEVKDHMWAAYLLCYFGAPLSQPSFPYSLVQMCQFVFQSSRYEVRQTGMQQEYRVDLAGCVFSSL